MYLRTTPPGRSCCLQLALQAVHVLTYVTPGAELLFTVGPSGGTCTYVRHPRGGVAVYSWPFRRYMYLRTSHPGRSCCLQLALQAVHVLTYVTPGAELLFTVGPSGGTCTYVRHPGAELCFTLGPSGGTCTYVRHPGAELCFTLGPSGGTCGRKINIYRSYGITVDHSNKLLYRELQCVI